MKKRRHIKLVHEGQYVAQVEVELIETDEGWSPYLSLEDAYKLDDVRDALRCGDLAYVDHCAQNPTYQGHATGWRSWLDYLLRWW